MDESGRRESCVFGVNRRTGDPEFLGSLMDGDIDEHNHFMRKKDPKVALNENDQLIAIEHFEFPTIHLPGGLLA